MTSEPDDPALAAAPTSDRPARTQADQATSMDPGPAPAHADQPAPPDLGPAPAHADQLDAPLGPEPGFGAPEGWPVRLVLAAGPVGLLLVCLVALWTGQMTIADSVIVQVDVEWERGGRLAGRVERLGPELESLPGLEARLEVVQGGRRWPLGTFSSAADERAVTAIWAVPPELELGPANLELAIAANGRPTLLEEIDLTIADRREPIRGAVTSSTHSAAQADDTSPHPEGWRIDVRAAPRVIAHYGNELWVRVTDAEGRPWRGELEVHLIDGSFAGHQARGSLGEPPVPIGRASTDRFGLAALSGRLESMLMRLRITVVAPPDPAPAPEPADDAPPDPEGGEDPARASAAPPRRDLFFLSWPGSVELTVERPVARPGQTVELTADEWIFDAPVYIDVHGPDGAWIDALISRAGPTRRLTLALPARLEGLVQLEAYDSPIKPGEDTAFARLWVTSAQSPNAIASELVAHHRQTLSRPRRERFFSAEAEARWLDEVAQAIVVQPVADAELERLARWLVETAPIERYGPPTALTTRAREEARLEARRLRWRRWLRIILWGGGSVYLIAAGGVLAHAHRRFIARIREALGDEQTGWVLGRPLLWRGGFMLVLIASSLLTLGWLLENLVW